MHVILRASEAQPVPTYVGHSKGFKRLKALTEGTAVHTDIGICTLEADGSIDLCV